MGIMEKKMETTLMGYTGFRTMALRVQVLKYWGFRSPKAFFLGYLDPSGGCRIRGLAWLLERNLYSASGQLGDGTSHDYLDGVRLRT